MMQWLTTILGIVVIGVVVELITKDGRMGKFIRSIYAFFILFVIVQPLPELLNNWQWFNPDDSALAVNADLVSTLNQTTKQAKVQQILTQMGYKEALVCVVDDVVYVNLGQTLSDEAMDNLRQAMDEIEVQII